MQIRITTTDREWLAAHGDVIDVPAMPTTLAGRPAVRFNVADAGSIPADWLNRNGIYPTSRIIDPTDRTAIESAAVAAAATETKQWRNAAAAWVTDAKGIQS